MIRVPLRAWLRGLWLRARALPDVTPGRPASPPTLADDAGHAPAYATHPHRFWYVEWWYFTFTDPVTKWSGIMALGVFNPTNEFGLGSGSATMVVYTPAGTRTAMDAVPLAAYSASPERADVTAGPNRITVIDPRKYRVQTRSADGVISCDLEFHAADEARWLGDKMPGSPPWAVSSWMSWMPAARASGTVTVQGQSVTLDRVPAYHDHNWAVWLFPFCTWTWAAATDPAQEVNLDFADQPSFRYRACYLRVGEERLDFCESLELTRLAWRRWMLLWKYPTAARIEGVDRSGRWRLELEWSAVQVAPLWRAPMIVFEQTARFRGTLSRREGDRWVPARELSLDGFFEYTAEWL